jgi:hypothetical protein
VVATVAAFFITQHLKVSTPLIAGTPAPFPAVINPADGVSCYEPALGKYVDHRQMRISFYLLNRSDTVDVYVADSSGRIVATLATDRYMQGGGHPVRSLFVWGGLESNGRIAPDGRYYVKVRLTGQRRTVTISNESGPEPVTVKTVPPDPAVTRVAPRTVSRRHLKPMKIDFTGSEGRSATVVIYRIGRHAALRQVKTFLTAWAANNAVWDGLIRKRPAPTGRYLIGLEVTDAACNTGTFPATRHPRLRAVSRAIVTIRR